jgi:hypothetical protein
MSIDFLVSQQIFGWYLVVESLVREIVVTFAPQFGALTLLRDGVATRRNLLFRSLILLLFVGFVGGSAPASADVQNPPVTSPGPGLPFAIADFDGDLRPDLARIQTGPTNLGRTEYWIQFQLSSAGRQSIRLVAPAGGLMVEALDVNGDHAVDLVLATALFRQPVAIFLNDGHGRFSRAEPTTFPRAFSESKTNLDSATSLATDTVGVPPQWSASIWVEEKEQIRERPPAVLTPPSSAGFPTNPFLVSQSDRAPPHEVPHL